MTDIDERHETFKKELYKYAELPNLAFQKIVADFVDDHSDLIHKELPVPMKFSRSEFKNFMKTWSIRS